MILSAIGSLNGVQFRNSVELPGKKAGYGYGDTLHPTDLIELAGAAGIICHDDEQNTNLHVHINLSDRHGNARGGHMAEGTKVLLTADAVLAEIAGMVIGRKFNDKPEAPLIAPDRLTNCPHTFYYGS